MTSWCQRPEKFGDIHLTIIEERFRPLLLNTSRGQINTAFVDTRFAPFRRHFTQMAAVRHVLQVSHHRRFEEKNFVLTIIITWEACCGESHPHYLG
jgi:hypothetical protein